VLRAIFHPEDRMFASCSSDRTAKYFSCDISKKTFEYISTTELVSMPVTAIDFSPDGRYLCTGGNDILKIWQMSKNGLLLESIDSAWKGVQDMIWCEKGIKGISSNAGSLSVWFCLLAEKKYPE
jgi:WD40 repeat protein